MLGDPGQMAWAFLDVSSSQLWERVYVDYTPLQKLYKVLELWLIGRPVYKEPGLRWTWRCFLWEDLAPRPVAHLRGCHAEAGVWWVGKTVGSGSIQPGLEFWSPSLRHVNIPLGACFLTGKLRTAAPTLLGRCGDYVKVPTCW